MAGYNTIRGLRVKYLSADPSNPEDGQVWYNSTTGNLRVDGVGVGAWSSGGNMGTARYNMTGTGTQTAALGAAGYLPGLSPSFGAKNTEEYDGSSWTNGGNMNQGKHEAGCFAGSQTSAIIASGYAGTANLSSSESYNGSSWTNTPSLNVARRATYQGMGSKAAAVCIGGTVSTAVSNVEEWNDSSWTSVTALPAVRRTGGSSGTQTAGIIFGGNIPPNTTTSFEYDGTNWTSGGALPTAISGMQPTNGPQGTQTAAGSFSGNDGTGPVTSSFTYNGTSWSTIESVSTGRFVGGGAGSTTAGLIFGGAIPSASPARSNATEEYNFSTDPRNITTS